MRETGTKCNEKINKYPGDFAIYVSQIKKPVEATRFDLY